MMGRAMRVGALIGLTVLGCDDADDGGQGGVDGALPGGAVCAFDDSTDRATAVPLTAGEAVTGALCPVGDADWYRFEVGAGQRLLTVALESTSPLTPVEPTYAVLAADGTPLGAPRPDEVRGTPLNITHCVPAGPVDVVVRDLGDDGQDLRHGYTLSVTAAADPDPAEPNDTAADAAALTVDAPVTGTIGCRGDVDVFRLAAPDRRVLRFRLQMPAGVVAPRVVVLGPGGETLTDQANPAGVREDTDLSRAVVLPAAGDYLVQVRDDDDGQADPAVEYTLSVALDEERDLNEPNDVAEQATVLSEEAVPCVETDWSGWFEVQGTVGVLGDRDWFRLPVSTCARGILEVEMAFDTAGLSEEEQRALLAEVQASVAVVRAHAGSPCAADEECRELQQGCGSNWDCTGLFNTCLPSRRCAGASTCLPEGACGAFLVEKHVTPPAGAPVPGEGAPANRVRFSAPSLTNEPIYLVAGDFGGDGLAPDTFYTLRARVRRDPDRHEPSNLYTPTIRRDDPIGLQLTYAVRRGNVAPVHDCAGGRKGLPDAGVEDAGAVDAGVPDAAPVDQGAPDAAPLVDAAAVVDAAPIIDAAPAVDAAPVVDAGPDLDAAPMADAGPMTDAAPMTDAGADGGLGPPPLVPGCCGPDDWIEGAISYEADQDFYVYAHPCPGEDCMVRILYEVEGGELWFDGFVPLTQDRSQPAQSGALGGLGAQDQCFYAFQGHGGGDDVYYYGVAVRDLLPDADYDAEQRYRFCVEKVADGCSEPPCQLYEDGCGAPR